MTGNGLKPVIEAVIFAADAPVSIERLCAILDGHGKAEVMEALASLMEEHRARACGISIEEVAGGYVFRTAHEFAPWIRRLFKIGLQKLSKAAMESLSIIAYKQPVTRAELESIRGVDSGGVLGTLMDKRFIKIVGRKEIPGRPVVYGTTKEFLETFDLKDLSCLPSLKDIQRTEGEDDLQKDQKDEAPGEEGRSGETPEDNLSGRGDIEAEGRGDDNRGPGEGEPGRGDGTRGQG